MSLPPLITGAIRDLSPAQRTRLLDRSPMVDGGVRETVRSIIDDVRSRGDAALRDMAMRFDGVALQSLEVPWDACTRALEALDADVRAALEEAAAAIRSFHRAQITADIEIETRPGVRAGRRSEPLARVGIYAPGGRAAYPSSVLMGVIPARIAGVQEVIVCSPAGPDGLPPAVVLAACVVAGADRVFGIGGAGAIAALALGTETVPRVAKIAGPGNAYVTEAKLQLNGVVGIDSPAGPSEVLVIGDAASDPALIAVELVAQAEHDPDAAVAAILVDAPGMADRVRAALESMVMEQPRRSIIYAALAARGAILEAASIDEALAFAEAYAPEHLSLMVADARDILPRVRCAGTVFLGAHSSVAFGDYMTGANHVLPTGALARSFSGLATNDFLRFVTWQEVDSPAAAAMSAPVATLALAEGLTAHALAATMRAGGTAATPIRAMARSRFAGITLYDPGRAPCALDLSDNTNLFGIPPAARAVLTSARPEYITRYPSVYADALKASIAGLHGRTPAEVVTGCGSDDVLDAVFRAFCDPGDTVAFPSPTFGVVDLFARMNGARTVPVRHTAELELDAPALARANARVTYICRPNNPTGSLYTRESVERVADAVRGVLVIDEAYAAFAGEDLTAFAASRDRVLVVRTLSKAHGLAGLRIGYAVGDPLLVAEVEKARGPYKVGALAEAAAIAAIEQDRAWTGQMVREACASRDRLYAELRRCGFAPLASAGNFLLVPAPAPLTAPGLAASLRAAGVAVRPFSDLTGIGDCIRVTAGPWPMMEQFMTALLRVTSSAQAEVA